MTAPYLIKVRNSQFTEFGSQPDKTTVILDATTGFPAKSRLGNDRRKTILMTRHYPDLGCRSDLSCRAGNLLQPIRNTTNIWILTRHQYGISALVFQTSFRRETSEIREISALFSSDSAPISLLMSTNHGKYNSQFSQELIR